MNPRLQIVDAGGRPTRQFLALVPGLRPHVAISAKGWPTPEFEDGWYRAFGERLPRFRIEQDGIATRELRERLLAVS